MEWISVEERLPKYNKTVLVNAEGFKEEGYYPLLVAKLIRKVEDENGLKLEWDDFQNIGLVDVTYWAEFPEPPENNNEFCKCPFGSQTTSEDTFSKCKQCGKKPRV